jgi:hypothetical protein
MGILSKLKFWKKDEEEFVPKEPTPLPGEKPSDELGMPELGPRPEAPQRPQMEGDVAPPPHLRDYQPTYAPPGQPPVDMHRIEIIDSKLDAIKAILSALDQRLANLERMAGHERRSW